jgi:hypothetical protein
MGLVPPIPSRDTLPTGRFGVEANYPAFGKSLYFVVVSALAHVIGGPWFSVGVEERSGGIP